MIEKLRERALTHGDFSIAVLLNQSADRIEELEAALRGMIRLAEAAKMDDRIIVYEARKALDTA